MKEIIEYVTEIYPEIKKIINKDESFSMQQLFLLARGMELVDNFTELDGNKKKEIVLMVVRIAAEDVLEEIILDENVLNQAVDLIVLASRGLLNINKHRGKIAKYLGGCCGGGNKESILEEKKRASEN